MGESFVEKVKVELASQNFEGAAAMLMKRLEENSKCDKSWSLLSEIQVKLGRYEEALHSANQACHADPGNASHRAQLSTALFNFDFKEQAAEQMKIALQLEPENPSILHVASQMTEPEVGLELISRALKRDQRNFPCWLVRVDLLLKTNRLSEAAESAEYLTKAGAQAPDSWVCMARVQVARGAPTEALASLKRALELDPQHPGAHALLNQIQAASAPQPERRAFRFQAGLKSPDGSPVFLRSELEGISLTLFASDASAAESMAYQSYAQALEQAGHRVSGMTVDGKYNISLENRGELNIPAPL